MFNIQLRETLIKVVHGVATTAKSHISNILFNALSEAIITAKLYPEYLLDICCKMMNYFKDW